MKILPEWTEKISLQQQAVLVLALRGPDCFPKGHTSKPLLYRYRACILAAAHKGRHLLLEESVTSLMSLTMFENSVEWEKIIQMYMAVVDELPLHYFTHLMHGAQVLAYKHPRLLFRARWLQFYKECCDYLHVPLETEAAMDARLSDFGRQLEEVC